MVILEERGTSICQTHTQQKFCFEDNANLFLHMLDNKDKTSRQPYAVNNALDKHKDAGQSDNFNHNDATGGIDVNDDCDTGGRGDGGGGVYESQYKITDPDDLYDKVLDLYEEYKNIRKTYSDKHGKGFYLKNEHKILERLVKKNAESKANLLRRFENLSLIYKDKHIKFDKNDTYNRIKQQYDSEVERIYGMSQINSYKEYIRYVFLAIELIANFAGFDMTGYTKFQTERIDKYEHILTEIGSIQTLVKLNTINPVVKLILLFTFNTICFIGIKVALKKDKSNGLIFNSIASVIGNCFSGPAGSASGGASGGGGGLSSLSSLFSSMTSSASSGGGGGASGGGVSGGPQGPQIRMRGPSIQV